MHDAGFDCISSQVPTRAVQQNLAIRTVKYLDATNAVGVAQLLAEATTSLGTLRENLYGTEWVNQHPIVKVLIDKLYQLANPSAPPSILPEIDVVKRIAAGDDIIFHLLLSR